MLPIPSSPGLQLTKTVTEPTFAAVGDVLHFQLTATNTGNVVADGGLDHRSEPGHRDVHVHLSGPPSTLAPGGTAAVRRRTR